MSIQIFKNKIPNDIFFELLDKICIKNDKYYIFNIESFKKGIYTEDIQKFIEFCKPFYYLSKRKYLERKLTQKSFDTILRQICNHNNIIYTSQIKYDKNTYDIVYFIYF
jgi:hypothetical protein